MHCAYQLAKLNKIKNEYNNFTTRFDEITVQETVDDSDCGSENEKCDDDNIENEDNMFT
ncbi:7175_t:CDS:2 [Dentiscutata heterogama]|uniref:7175_t:CDS:1 n=1 Tax=Dentiscutata heterogama TaxID=1316150 RepID=A0ACA9MMW5_9GLOM|nr:7175_t:CDS:2 [Dentiscutata heterogama]